MLSVQAGGKALSLRESVSESQAFVLPCNCCFPKRRVFELVRIGIEIGLGFGFGSGSGFGFGLRD